MSKKPRELWTYAQISELTGVTAATLRVWRTRGKLPPVNYFVGEWPAWEPDVVRAWWEKRQETAETV